MSLYAERKFDVRQIYELTTSLQRASKKEAPRLAAGSEQRFASADVRGLFRLPGSEEKLARPLRWKRCSASEGTGKA